jgi:hypothetical protein
MSEDHYKGIDIDLNIYKRGGRWTGAYILVRRIESRTINEVNLLTERCATSEEARELALCEARRAIDRFIETAPALLQQLRRATRA